MATKKCKWWRKNADGTSDLLHPETEWGMITGSITAHNTSPTRVATFGSNDGAHGLSYSTIEEAMPKRLKPDSGNAVSDPNSITASGFYYISGDTKQRPPFKQVEGNDSTDYRIINNMTANSDTWQWQLAMDLRSNDLFARRNQNGTWKEWTAYVKMPQGATGTSLCPPTDTIPVFDNGRNATIKNSGVKITDLAKKADIPTIPSLSRTVSGGGNAITDITVNGHSITLTKGSTFALKTEIPNTDDFVKITGEQTIRGIKNFSYPIHITPTSSGGINTSYDALSISCESDSGHRFSLTFPEEDGTFATTNYVDTKVAGIVNSAPATLDTLNELAKALGNDPNFATTVSTQIGGKVSKSGDTMTGALKFAQSACSDADGPSYLLAMTSFSAGGEVKYTHVRNLTSKGNLQWTSATHTNSTGALFDGNYIPTINTLAYWNGAYQNTSSNLTYCTDGEILSKNGGTLTANAQIQRAGKSVTWVNGRDGAVLRTTSSGTSTSAQYCPIFSQKTVNGSWEFGAYTSDIAHLSYITDANHTAGKNEQTADYQFAANKKGEVAVITDITWLNTSGKPSWIGNEKPDYSYSEITGLSDNFVTLGTAQTITGKKTINSSIIINDPTPLSTTKEKAEYGFSKITYTYTSTGGTTVTHNYQLHFPKKEGTIALTSDIPDTSGFVTLNTKQGIGGEKTFYDYIFVGDTGGEVAEYGPTYITYHSYNDHQADYTYTFPQGSGTIALTSDIKTYIASTGISISSSNAISTTAASSSASGHVSTGSQTFAGRKTFNGGINIPSGATIQLNGSSGTAGYVLTSNGANAAPSWKALPSGGAVRFFNEIFHEYLIGSDFLSIPIPMEIGIRYIYFFQFMQEDAVGGAIEIDPSSELRYEFMPDWHWDDHGSFLGNSMLCIRRENSTTIECSALGMDNDYLSVRAVQDSITLGFSRSYRSSYGLIVSAMILQQ